MFRYIVCGICGEKVRDPKTLLLHYSHRHPMVTEQYGLQVPGRRKALERKRVPR